MWQKNDALLLSRCTAVLACSSICKKKSNHLLTAPTDKLSSPALSTFVLLYLLDQFPSYVPVDHFFH